MHTSRLRSTILGAAALMAVPALAQAKPFTILIYEDSAQIALRTDGTDKGKTYWNSYAAVGKAMADAGILRGGGALSAETDAKVVEIREGAQTVRDGAYASTERVLGGYFIVDVPALEDALAWAAKVPAATTGSVEVRPHFPVPGMP